MRLIGGDGDDRQGALFLWSPRAKERTGLSTVRTRGERTILHQMRAMQDGPGEMTTNRESGDCSPLRPVTGHPRNGRMPLIL